MYCRVDWALFFGCVGAVTGLLGAGAAVAAVIYAHEANAKSDASNEIAEAARSLARDANAIAARAEARETERHDVRWTGDWVGFGVYRVMKRGEDEARNVSISVTVDDEERTAAAEVVDGDGRYFDLVFPRAAAAQQRYAAEWERSKKRAAEGSYITGSSGPTIRMHSVVEHIQWVTARGNPKTHNDESRHSMPH